MQNISSRYRSVARQIGHFIIHLRWHYQLFILSSGYLLGGYISGVTHWPEFLLQFLNVHLLLFGGATAFNSFWDKDNGPIGGVKNPPKMHRWMRHASFGLQLIGLIIAVESGWLFAFVYALSMLFFWLYSTPHFRWKADPRRSLVAIGISTGTNTVLLGCLAAGGKLSNIPVWFATFGCSLMILSLYPVSQLFQTDEDYARGDETFAVKYGTDGVISFFKATFGIGLILVGFAIGWTQWEVGTVFVILGMMSGAWVYRKLSRLRDQKISYDLIMSLKYRCSMLFLGFILVLMIRDYFL